MHATGSSGTSAARKADAGPSRHRFLLLALLAGPVVGLTLLGGAQFGALSLPHARFSGSALAVSLLLAPLLEELVFRGGIQDALDRTSWGRIELLGGLGVGNLLTSLLFAAAHLMMVPAWLAAATFFPSLVFGRLKQLYPSLLPAVLVHAWFNACYLAVGAAI